MAFFALVHGGAHGGWCWERLVPELEALGHRASAPDLPFDDPHGVSDWADTVVDTIPPDAGRTVVVGHSLGGLCIPVVAERAAVDHLVFLGAMVPVPGRSMMEVMADEPDTFRDVEVAETVRDVIDTKAFEGAGDAVMPYAQAHAMFYGDLDETTARSAWQRLRRQGLTSFTEPSPLERWPDVRSTYVLMKDDGAVNPEWSRRVARGRLAEAGRHGSDLVELEGSHSPFFSRPRELAELLDRIATP